MRFVAAYVIGCESSILKDITFVKVMKIGATSESYNFMSEIYAKRSFRFITFD